MEIFGVALVEWFGYLASMLVALSLTMSSIVKLRWYNLVGAGMFSTYGFIIGSLPVGLLNLFIVVTDIFYLIRMYREIDDFSIMQLTGADEYLRCFLDTFSDEISRLFPNFDSHNLQNLQIYYLVKNATPIGILAGYAVDEKIFRVELDFVKPEYRDFKMGRFVYNPAGFFYARGYRTLQAPSGNKLHDQYLQKMGFSRQGTVFEKELDGRSE
ncbi:MAG: hypothetical protein ACOCVC_03245 [Spirochaeta sp.]